MTADTDKDLPLKEDTRFLGRVLGDVLRAQTGDDGYGRVEAIRQAAVRFHRAASDEAREIREEVGFFQAIRAALVKSFPELSDISIKVGFPAFVSIQAVERNPVLAWKQKDQLLWIDAHLDAHTERTSPSQALHGMPVACLLGDGPRVLTMPGGRGPRIAPERLCMLGIRDYEPDEK